MNDREHKEFGYRKNLRKPASPALKRRDQERHERELRDFMFLDFRAVTAGDVAPDAERENVKLPS